MIITIKILVCTALATLLATGLSASRDAERKQAAQPPAIVVASSQTDGADGKSRPATPALGVAVLMQHCPGSCDWGSLFRAR